MSELPPEMLERFQCVVEEVFDGRPIPGGAVDLIDAGGLDSFDLLRLFMSMEDEFGVMWPPDQMSRFRELRTLDHVRDAVAKELLGA
jgi:acyl carrier protein